MLVTTLSPCELITQFNETLTTPFDASGQPQTATLTSYYFGGAYEVTGSSIEKYYSFGGQTIMRDANGLQYFLTDHLGSIVAVTDDHGTLISEQRYLPFGGERTNAGAITQTDYGYTGQRKLDSGMGGLMDYKARFYSPCIMRFMQPDTIIPDLASPQSLNRYSYVTNRPVNFNDPTGHMPVAGCGGEGKSACHASDEEIRINARRDADFRNETNRRKCAGGNKNYCSGWKNIIGDPTIGDLTYGMDVAAYHISAGEMLVTDTLGAITIAGGCILGEGAGCLPAIGLAAVTDVVVAGGASWAWTETFLGWASFLLITGNEFYTKTNYIEFDNNGGVNVGFGRDTLVSLNNAIRGSIWEANVDFWRVPINSNTIKEGVQEKSPRAP